MTPHAFLSEAQRLDHDIDFLDALYTQAVTSDAHPRVRQRILSRRNELTKQWSETWSMRKVEP